MSDAWCGRGTSPCSSWKWLAWAALLTLIPAAGGLLAIEDIGVVGRIRKMDKDRHGFEFTVKMPKLPGKVRVALPAKFECKSFEVIPIGKIKDGETIFVLGIPQEGTEYTGPQIGTILAIASGDFRPPDELPKRQSKMKGLAWISGSLARDGKKLKLDDQVLSIGTNRPVVVVKRGKRVEIDKKRTVYVRGVFHKKDRAKKEKAHHIQASEVHLVHAKVSPKEYAYLFPLGKLPHEKEGATSRPGSQPGSQPGSESGATTRQRSHPG